MVCEIELLLQMMEDEDVCGKVFCCYGVKFVKRGVSIEGWCKLCFVISKYIQWLFGENFIKDKYSI